MNKVFLIGRLTKDPEIRYNYQNIAITRFTLAVARTKQKDREEETDFISCVCFNNQAKNFVKYQKKGNLVALFGRIRTAFYDDEKTNKRVYTTDVVADEIKYLSFKEENQTQINQNVNNQIVEGNEKYSQLSAKTVMNEDYNQELRITDDDLPF